jgi:dimethylglycine dehydrogenase
MGSYYLRRWHMRWFNDHLDRARDGDVTVRDISDAMVGFSLSGPNARKVLEKLTHQDVGDAALPFMGCTEMDVGLIRTRVGRLSVTGELGYEINCAAAEHITLREILLEAGAGLGMREYGYYALNSLRLEKSFGIWSKEFTQGYTPGMTGMDRWIDFSKADFIGKAAAQEERDRNTAPQRLVTLEVASPDADASGYEPVWKDGKRIGFVTSGGYGHTVRKSLAMALVAPELAEPGTRLKTHIVGVERDAVVIEPSPHDPSGSRMRG